MEDHEIRKISSELKLSHHDHIDARLAYHEHLAILKKPPRPEEPGSPALPDRQRWFLANTLVPRRASRCCQSASKSVLGFPRNRSPHVHQSMTVFKR